MLEFKVSGLDDVKRRLRDLTEDIKTKVLERACRSAALFFAKECKARCRSDVVRSSIKLIRLPDSDTPGQFTYLVSAGHNVRVAHLLEFGTKPHRIVPNTDSRKWKNMSRNAWVETIKNDQGGELRVSHRAGASLSVVGRLALNIGGNIRPSAKHPGSKAKPFMRPAFDEASDRAIDAFLKSAEREFKKLERAGDIAPDYGGGF